MELKDITLYELIKDKKLEFEIKKLIIKKAPYEKDLQTAIYDAADLENDIKSGIINNTILTEVLESIYKLIKKKSFSQPDFNVSLDFDETNPKYKILNYADLNTNGSVLINYKLTNHIINSNLKVYSLKSIKYLLNHYSLNGNNALMNTIHTLGPLNMPQLIEYIKFYNEQVFRTAATTDYYEGNIFFKDIEKKSKIVVENLEEILNYLLQYESFIWGDLSKTGRYDLQSGLRKLRKNRIYTNKESILFLIKIITNYTTLEELESSNVNKILNRFIKK